VSPKRGVAPVRRAQIVRATIRCLARDGYAGLAMKRVAAEAGLAPGILHYYFRDKRAILASAAAQVTADLDRRVGAAARQAGDARGRLRALIRACLEVATRDHEFWTVFIELWGEALHDPELAALNRRAYTRARRLIAAGLAQGVAEGALRRAPTGEAAALVLALVDGMSLQLTFDPALMSPARAARLIEDALWRCLAAPGAPSGGTSDD
jgi:AcrR family transcriptional regulator